MFSLPEASSGMSHAPLHHETSGTARGTASPKVAKSPDYVETNVSKMCLNNTNDLRLQKCQISGFSHRLGFG
jgi:hypothetical protein